MASTRDARVELTTSQSDLDVEQQGPHSRPTTPPAMPTAAQPRARWDGTLGARLLLAEDDTEVRRLLAHALRKDGHDVVEVSSGTELLEHLHRCVADGRALDLPDVIVTDIRMPGPSGLEVLAGLRRAEWTLPIILTTAFGDRETHARALRLGAIAVFDKPFDVDDLRTVVMNVMRMN